MAKILLIDDDAKQLTMMRAVLIRSGHVVIEATDGIDGMRKFHDEAPNVVITDIMMPHRDGIETIQAIRDVNPTVGVIAISGGGVRGGELYLSVASQIGADAVLQKPFRAAELSDAVEKVLFDPKTAIKRA